MARRPEHTKADRPASITGDACIAGMQQLSEQGTTRVKSASHAQVFAIKDGSTL